MLCLPVIVSTPLVLWGDILYVFGGSFTSTYSRGSRLAPRYHILRVSSQCGMRGVLVR